MGDFFDGWRRKAALSTLAMARALLGKSVIFQNGAGVTCHCIGVFSDAVASPRKLAIERH